MFRKFMTAAAVTAPVCFRNVPQFRPAFADESEAPRVPVAKIIVEDAGEAEDDAAWVLEKQGCSICSNFIRSPCKIVFRQWSKCTEMSNKEEMAAACTDYTAALFLCIHNNEDYFSRRVEGEEAEEEAEEGEAEGGHSEPVVEAPATATTPAIAMSSVSLNDTEVAVN